jgi:hypothetical protein
MSEHASSPAAGCTIAARNYLPYVRVLAAGWHRHHAAPLFALVVDAEPGEVAEPGIGILTPEDLGIDPGELGRLRGIYDVAELTTALKPALLRVLLERTSEPVLYLDADTDVHGALDGTAVLARAYGIALSPHLLEPAPADGLSPSESEIAWGGFYNSGFLAVARSAGAFLDWWAARLRRDCLFCEPMSMHADQRWLDLVPSYFPHTIVRDPGVNVAQWNVHERPIRREEERWLAKGGPLRTLHFSGYDPADPELLASGGWPRPLRFDAAAPELRALCADYGARLMDAGYPTARDVRYRHARSVAGTPLTPWRRLAYRELLLAAEARGRELPHPFDAGRSDAFERLIADPQATGLLSPAAQARLEDAQIALPPGAAPSTSLDALLRGARQLARRLPVHANGWQPYPLPSDRTLAEYQAAAIGTAP